MDKNYPIMVEKESCALNHELRGGSCVVEGELDCDSGVIGTETSGLGI